MHGEESRHARSEATRLLSAGGYLDDGFRQSVIDELIGHPERPVAPSLGVDVQSVLAHALRARRQQVFAALALLALWAGFFATEYAVPDGGSTGTEPLAEQLGGFAPLGPAVLYAGVCFLLLMARAVSGRPVTAYTVVGARKVRRARSVAGAWLTWVAWNAALGYWIFALAIVTDDPFALVFPLLLTAVVWMYRAQVGAVLRDELGQDRFPYRPGATRLPDTARCRTIGRAIAREQHAQGAVYEPHLPFVGAGIPYAPWSFALELKRDKQLAGEAAGNGAAPLTPRQVIELIKPRLSGLREAAGRTSLDRLRQLEVEEFVFLPSGAHRNTDGVYERSSIEAHLGDAVNEGGEARRHFLRIRVGAWDELVVVTVFVRVHTQGSMLVLEVAPHVLGPVREEFRDVDAIAARNGGRDVLREAVRALLLAPTAGVALGASAAGSAIAACRTWLAAAPGRALPDAPHKSVREMGSSDSFSLFQEMDVSRYVKTIQDRIAGGVRDALEQRGFRTDRFEQQIVNVSEGGLFIKDMTGGTAVGHISESAVSTGERGKATHTSVEGSTAG